MKKILILGGSHRDIPLIKASQNLGYFVITLGDRDYYLGHNYSDKAYLINFNDLEKVREIIKNEKIDFILPGCGEESYLNTVKLSKEFSIGNFDSENVAKLIHNKWKFKEFCLENNISTPKGEYFDKNLNLNLNFPIVVKPTNLSGGRGVEIVNNEIELKKSIVEAQEVSNEIFLEEFIKGDLIAYSVFIINKKIAYGFIGDDISFLNKYLITTAYPISAKKEILEKLKNDIEKLSSILNIANGMFHFQILVKEDKPYIIDVTRRIPGDLYPYLIEYNDKIKYSQAVVQAYTTGKINHEFLEVNRAEESYIRHCIMPSKNGIYKGLEIDNLLKNKIVYRLDLMEKDSLVKDFLNTQVSIVFVKVDKNDNIILGNLNKLIYPKIEEV